MVTLKKNTELQEFIVIHPDNWETLLTSDPYNLHVKRDEHSPYVLFKYDQIRSDMSQEICRESRGIIIDSTDWSVACRAFDKFFNIQEQFASPIDWSTARVQEKVDGSILKLWFDKHRNEWHLSTNGAINAHEAEVMFPTEKIRTFHDLFMAASDDWFSRHEDTLIKGFTYIWEIVSPHNRVVVSYPEPDIYHIGTRENSTGIEYTVDIGIQHPKHYDFEDVDAVLSYAETMPYSEEGFVVVDANWNRVKIKSAEYVRIHRLRGETIPTKKRILDIVRFNGSDDFLSYFPEYKEQFDEVQRRYVELFDQVVADVVDLETRGWIREEDRKKFATEFALRRRVPDILFNMRDGKIGTSSEDVVKYFQEVSLDKLLGAIGL